MDLWKDNMVANKWSMETAEIARRFIEYDDRHKLSNGWPLDRCVRAFLTDKEDDGGLQSVFDESEYEEVFEACRKARWPKD